MHDVHWRVWGGCDLNSELDSIGQRMNTDKASYWVRPDGVHDEAHDYLRHYETAFSDYRNDEIVFMDLGVGFEPNRFASARMWAEYFPKAHVVAIDIEAGLESPHDRIEFVQADLGSLAALTDLTRRFRPDIVIDDASHTWPHQIQSLAYLFPALQAGGLYVWEDLHTSGPSYGGTFANGYEISPVELLGLMVQKIALRDSLGVETATGTLRALPAGSAGLESRLCGAFAPIVDMLTQEIDSITVFRRSAIIRKRT
jgi:hypothetical protein